MYINEPAHLGVSVHLAVGGRDDAGHDVLGGDLPAGAHLGVERFVNFVY